MTHHSNTIHDTPPLQHLQPKSTHHRQSGDSRRLSQGHASDSDCGVSTHTYAHSHDTPPLQHQQPKPTHHRQSGDSNRLSRGHASDSDSGVSPTEGTEAEGGTATGSAGAHARTMMLCDCVRVQRHTRRRRSTTSSRLWPLARRPSTLQEAASSRACRAWVHVQMLCACV